MITLLGIVKIPSFRAGVKNEKNWERLDGTGVPIATACRFTEIILHI